MGKAATVPALVPEGETAVATEAPASPIRFIEGVGHLVGTAPNVKSFLTEADALAYVSVNEVSMFVDRFHAHVVAHIDHYFTVPGKRASKKRDGTDVAERPARVLEGKMLDAAMTRLLGAARKVYEFETSQNAAIE